MRKHIGREIAEILGFIGIFAWPICCWAVVKYLNVIPDSILGFIILLSMALIPFIVVRLTTTDINSCQTKKKLLSIQNFITQQIKTLESQINSEYWNLTTRLDSSLLDHIVTFYHYTSIQEIYDFLNDKYLKAALIRQKHWDKDPNSLHQCLKKSDLDITDEYIFNSLFNARWFPKGYYYTGYANDTILKTMPDVKETYIPLALRLLQKNHQKLKINQNEVAGAINIVTEYSYLWPNNPI